jgi:hypothetical protein
MGRLRSNVLRLAVAILSLWSFSGCGGGAKPGPPIFPGRINLSPGGNTSLVVGGVLNFSASAATSSGTNISTAFTFTSSDTSILTLAPNGVACAGHWDINYTVCTPGNIGPVQVTASTLGASSVPTYVFVHPPIDNITVTGVLLDGVPVQEPCLSQSQSMTVEARAFSNGADITSSVGPFTWSANNLSVVNLIPLVNSAFNFPTNRATATAFAPGMTQIYASAGGITSSSFLQPQLQNSQGNTSPALDFFETCPIQKITLALGQVGSGQTSFVAAKAAGTQTVFATITDIMGNSSLPNTNGGIVLSRVPLTWTSSQPAVVGASAGCVESCSLSVSLPGSGSVSASCSPPSCNAGFPLIPASLSSAAAVDACTQYFHAQYPQLVSCQELIPVPVYADIAISGVVTGSASPVGVLATSTGCAHLAPAACSSSVYSFSTSRAATGSENPFPVPPNSLLYDLAGDRVFMGSDFGAQVINPANFGTTSSAYSALGTVTGNVLAASNSGTVAVFSDTIHTPNQAYIVNVANVSSPTATALNISSAVAAAFSPDGLKTFILGGNTSSSLYVYSTVQALQGPITLQGPGKGGGFSPNGAFGYVATAASGTASANLAAYATCNNQLAANLPLPADPIVVRVLPQAHIDGRDSYGYTIPDGVHVLVLDATGFDIITSTISAPAPGNLCPQTLTFISNDLLRPAQRVELNQGTLQPPLNFFASADGSQLYIASGSNASILVYDFATGGVTGIELIGSATPLSADMSADDGTILVAGSDGMLHEITTSLGGADLVQLPFPNLPNYLNPFCTGYPTQGPCTLNLVLAKP